MVVLLLSHYLFCSGVSRGFVFGNCFVAQCISGFAIISGVEDGYVCFTLTCLIMFIVI